jgi:transcriptional antiterminator RfaH
MRNADVPPGRDAPWYVAHTKSRQEKVARDNLLRQNYAIYLPQLKVLKRVRRRQQVGFEPLFPRYLFFQPSDANHSIAPVRSTLGVAGIVRFGGIPAVLRPDRLESIRKFESGQHAVDLEELELSVMRPGKRVVVAAGPLAGLEGLVAMVSNQRVIVLMRMLGAETKVALGPGELRLAA